MVEQSAFIAVLMTDGQQVKNKLFRLPTPLSDPQLQLLSTLLNTSFTGLTLEQLGPGLWSGSPPTPTRRMALIHLVVSFAMEVLEELEANVVHTAGIPHPAGPSGVKSLERAEPLMVSCPKWGRGCSCR